MNESGLDRAGYEGTAAKELAQAEQQLRDVADGATEPEHHETHRFLESRLEVIKQKFESMMQAPDLEWEREMNGFQSVFADFLFLLDKEHKHVTEEPQS